MLWRVSVAESTPNITYLKHTHYKSRNLLQQRQGQARNSTHCVCKSTLASGIGGLHCQSCVAITHTTTVQHQSRCTACIQCQHNDAALPLSVPQCRNYRCQFAFGSQNIYYIAGCAGYQRVCAGKPGWTPLNQHHTTLCECE